MRAHWFLLLLLPALVACPSRRGGGGGGGDDDDSASSGPTSLAETLDYASVAEIHPNEAGLALGLNECTLRVNAVITRDNTLEGCSACVGIWTGPTQPGTTDCNSADVDNEVTFGFALAEDGLEVWSFDDESEEFTLTGVASSSDGAWRLVQTIEMGEGDFSLGEMDSDQTWQ